MSKDLNVVTLTGRLTRDPELRHTPSGQAVAKLRLAWTTRTKASGDWEDHSNFIDVSVWGAQGESCAQYLAKGRRIALDGRLEFREWDAQDGTKRSTHEITANNIIYLDSRGDGDGQGEYGGGYGDESQEPVGRREPDFVPAANTDDDIPF